jgi:hypothetical protein
MRLLTGKFLAAETRRNAGFRRLLTFPSSRFTPMNEYVAWRRADLALRCAVAVAALGLAGCSSGTSFPKTYEIKGSVLVNGKPAQDVQVTLNRTSADKLALPASPHGVTDSKGEFYITSYNSDDGAPDGDYVVTIEWREATGIIKKDFDGPDRLGGAYSKVDKNKGTPGFTVKVEGKPQELAPFKLTQSPEAKARAEAGKKGMDFKGGMK